MEQVIKLTGRILKALPEQSGTSQRTGNTWKAKDYVLEYFEWSGASFARKLAFTVFGEDRIKDFNLKEGEDNVTVTLSTDAHEYNNRWFNEIRAIKIERPAAETPAQAVTQEYSKAAETTEAPAAEPHDRATHPNVPSAEGEDPDDLPF